MLLPRNTIRPKRTMASAISVLLTASAAVVAVPTTAAAAELDVDYTGVATAAYRAPTTVSAKVTLGEDGHAGAKVTFRVGDATCEATSTSTGAASCTLAPVNKPGYYGISVRVESPAGRVGTFHTFQVKKATTALAYNGTRHLANDEPAKLAATLKDGAGQAVPERTVRLALGAGGAEQACNGATSSGGDATCTVDKVNQDLNTEATVPLSAAFAGDDYYLPSNATSTAVLQYATGRAFGASADVNLILFPVKIPPQPDTGVIRTARATTNRPQCSGQVKTIGVNIEALCAEVNTSLNPGTSTAKTTVKSAKIGLPGLPVLDLSGVEAVSTSTCTKAEGHTGTTLKIAGKTIDVPNVPNTVIDLGVARLVINEQLPAAGADKGMTVNAVHLKDALGLIDVVIGSATTGAHNCAPAS
ncbi:hypothetical protein J7I98_12635 [Streptomyces sp. ISL-98]|uniref:choice-of-anchor P family protein n=1 Tax=Streptomyces sp. ISL-98 TaxID=2819192 RepID=UPI001BECC3EB|nr:choice-of-anchor P family protein [Streptomyces sp. ISL-98]MBT2506723.1 hypothetical protein [Streptomyces sp. ISL-98]